MVFAQGIIVFAGGADIFPARVFSAKAKVKRRDAQVLQEGGVVGTGTQCAKGKCFFLELLFFELLNLFEAARARKANTGRRARASPAISCRRRLSGYPRPVSKLAH